MKCRIGFVSNSSSESFCMFGIGIEYYEVIKKLNKKYKKLFDKEFKIKDDNYSNIEKYDLFEFLNNIDLNIKCNSGPPYEDYIYIGKEWCDIKDNETGLQFKNSIKNEIKLLFKDSEDLKFKTHEISWNN